MWPARPRWSPNESSNRMFPSPPLYAPGGKLLWYNCVSATGWRIYLELYPLIYSSEFQGTPASARHISLPLLFLPIFLLQGAGVLFATLRFVEKIVLLLRSGAVAERYHVFSSRVRDCFAFMHHGSR